MSVSTDTSVPSMSPAATGRTIIVAMTAALAPITWGSTYFVTEAYLPPERPLFGAVVRALPVGLVFLIAVRQLPRGHWWWRAAVLSVLNVGAFFPLVFLASYHLSSGLASTLTATGPFAVMSLAWLLVDERPKRAAIAGASAGLLGVLVLVSGAGLRVDMIGVLASIGAITFSSLGFVLVKRWSPQVSMLTLTAWQLVGGGILLVPTALVAEGLPPTLKPDELLAYAYLGFIGTGLAFVVWFRGVSRMRAGSVAVIGMLNPAVGTVLGVAFAGEAFGLNRAVGICLILGGVLAGVRTGRASSPAAAAMKPTPAGPAATPVAAPKGHQLPAVAEKDWDRVGTH